MKTVIKGQTMLDTIKNSVLSVCKIPVGVESFSKEFSTHTVILLSGDKIGETKYLLPAHRKMYREKYEYPVFGLRALNRDILVIQDMYSEPGETLSDADADYFADLNDFEFYDTMRHKDLTTDDLFLPLNSFISTKPTDKICNNVLLFTSAVHAGSVYVKEGSNRHKFITGQADFLDDPYDFFTTRDTLIDPSMIETSAKSRNIYVEQLLPQRLTDNPLKACMTLFLNKNIWETACQAIRIRKSTKSKFTVDTYWGECEDPHRGVPANYKAIRWDLVEQAAKDIDNSNKGYQEIASLIMIDETVDSWSQYNLAVFMTFWLLLSDETIDFISNSFELKGGNS